MSQSVGSFSFIWIPVLWVYSRYQYFYSYSAGIDSSRQILMYNVDIRAVRVKYQHVVKHQPISKLKTALI